MTRLLLAGLLTLPSIAAATPPDSIYFPIIAELPDLTIWGASFGDADHDGWRELVARERSPSRTTCIFEHVGNNQYERHPLFVDAKPYCLGDGDGDGLADLMLRDSPDILLLESPDSFSFPSETSYVREIGEGSIWSTGFTDMDRDGLTELAFSKSRGVYLLECRGNNRYDSIAVLETPDASVRFAYGDADRDGWPDVVVGDYWQTAYVFEATGNDSFTPVARCSTGMDTQNPAVTHDMDGDGRREIVFAEYTGSHGKVEVWECTGDNSYDRVWFREVELSEDFDIALGDVDGDGRQEFATHNGRYIDLYANTGDNQYEQVWRSEPNLGHRVLLYDLNDNGRDEMIHRDWFGGDEHVAIRELPDSVSIHEPRHRPLDSVPMFPTIVRPGARIKLPGLEPGTSIEVMDASGRLLRNVQSGVIRTEGLSAGAYFLRLSSGKSSVLKKLLVLP